MQGARRAGKGGAGVACVSLEVLYERCAVHGTARCGWTPLRLPRTEAGAATDRARGGNTGLADGGTGECVRACGALQLELVGTRCAAPTALPPCEPPVPLQACTRRARMPNEAAARGSQRNTGAGDGKERRWRTAGDAKKVHLSRRGVLAAGGGDNLRT